MLELIALNAFIAILIVPVLAPVLGLKYRFLQSKGIADIQMMETLGSLPNHCEPEPKHPRVHMPKAAANDDYYLTDIPRIEPHHIEALSEECRHYETELLAG